MASVESEGQTVAAALTVASASAPSAEAVAATALVPAHSAAERSTSPTLGLCPAADLEYGVSAVLYGVAQCRGRAAMATHAPRRSGGRYAPRRLHRLDL